MSPASNIDRAERIEPEAAPPARRNCHIPVKRAALAKEHAPDVTIPLRFMVVGMLSLFLGTGLLAARPGLLIQYHYNQQIIALTHLFVLGWLLSVLSGAVYQLIPVGLLTRLHSQGLAKVHFVLHVAGFAGMVFSFWKWEMKCLGIFGLVLAAGVLVFSYNVARTLRQVPGWPLLAAFSASALVWLNLTVWAGLFAAMDKVMGLGWFEPLSQMHAHANLGVLGVFVMMLAGVSYKVVPMFCIGELQSPGRAWGSFWLLNAGVAGSFVAILLRSPWKFAAALCAVAGLVLYLVEMWAVVSRAKRSRLDWGLRTFLGGVSLLVPLMVLALVLSWPKPVPTETTARLENLFGFLALAGFLTLATLGMLYKIVPLLVWYRSYSGMVGRHKVPAMADLYSARLQTLGFSCWLIGVAGAGAGIISGQIGFAQAGVGFMALSMVLFACNIGRIFSHLFRPRLKPRGLPELKAVTAL